jgi:hypothetical protein
MPFSGANTVAAPSNPQKQSFHNHSDSQINSLAKSAGTIAKGVKKQMSSSSSSSMPNPTANTPTLSED